MYIFALLLDTSLCKQSYILYQSKDLVEKNLNYLFRTLNRSSICPQMNERQQRKPVIDSASETRKKEDEKETIKQEKKTSEEEEEVHSEPPSKTKIWRRKSQ